MPAELIIKKGGGHPWPTIHEEVQVMADWFDKQTGQEVNQADAPSVDPRQPAPRNRVSGSGCPRLAPRRFPNL